jgi:hypothetical protein
MHPESVALWCAVPLAIAVVVDALEVIADRAQLRDGGLYGYTVLTTGRPVLLMGPLAAPLATLFRYPAVLILPAAQLAAAGLLVGAAISHAPSLIVPAGLAALIILAARMLFYLRNQLGLDGSDQMLLVACTVVAGGLLLPDPQAQALALYYGAAQLLLSYAVSGIAKAISPTWRSGRALAGIMGTVGYGTPRFAGLLSEHPGLSRLLCWSVIVFECSAPLLVLAGTPGALIIIVGGLVFHASIAIFMGLNIFLWSFASMYPALLFLAHGVDQHWR